MLQYLSGKFVVFEGPDGCGKTTQMESLITRLHGDGVVVRRLREPGGTPIGEQIRELLLSTKSEMNVRCEMLLYMASRAQLVHEQVKPALAAGECVLSDRFASSTLAYQGGGGGMDLQEILNVAQSAVGPMDGGGWPHLTIVFDLEIDQAMRRLNPLFHDRIEQRDREYFQRVRENYLWQAKKWPERYRIVDASKPIPHVEEQVSRTLADFFSR